MIYFRPLVGQTVLAIGVFILLCWFGVWQVERLAWKLDLIETTEHRASGKPLPLEDVLKRPSLEDMRYQKVIASGTFDHSTEVFLYAPHIEGSGFRVITPFFPRTGDPVLVDRGWVPNERRLPETRLSGQIAGETTITGIVLLPGEATLGVPGQLEGGAVWMFRDLKGMASHMALPSVAPVFVVALPTEGEEPWPRPEAPNLTFRNSHLGYAITWFGLAFALLSVYIAFNISQGRLRIGKKQEDQQK